METKITDERKDTGPLNLERIVGSLWKSAGSYFMFVAEGVVEDLPCRGPRQYTFVNLTSGVYVIDAWFDAEGVVEDLPTILLHWAQEQTMRLVAYKEDYRLEIH